MALTLSTCMHVCRRKWPDQSGHCRAASRGALLPRCTSCSWRNNAAQHARTPASSMLNAATLADDLRRAAGSVTCSHVQDAHCLGLQSSDKLLVAIKMLPHSLEPVLHYPGSASRRICHRRPREAAARSSTLGAHERHGPLSAHASRRKVRVAGLPKCGVHTRHDIAAA